MSRIKRKLGTRACLTYTIGFCGPVACDTVPLTVPSSTTGAAESAFASTGNDTEASQPRQTAALTPDFAPNLDEVRQNGRVAATFYRANNYQGSSPHDVEIPADSTGTVANWQGFNIRSVRMKPGCTMYLYLGERYIVLTTDRGEQFPDLDDIYNTELPDFTRYAIECNTAGPPKGTARTSPSTAPSENYLHFWKWKSVVPDFWNTRVTIRALSINHQVSNSVFGAVVSSGLPYIPSYALRAPAPPNPYNDALEAIRVSSQEPVQIQFLPVEAPPPLQTCILPDSCYFTNVVCATPDQGGRENPSRGRGINMEWCNREGGLSYCTSNLECVRLR